MSESLILIGAGGHCASCIDVIERENKYRIEAIVDLPEKKGSKILNYNIEYADEDLKDLVEKYKNVLITIGQIKTSELRANYFNKLKAMGAYFPTIISPLADVSTHAQVGEGTIVMHHCLVNANVKVGANCILNSKSLLEHDVEVGDHCHISTGAILNGEVKVGSESFIGSNSVVIQRKVIDAKTVIGFGEAIK